MPYWKCPKCGSAESYEGTELVTEVKGSGGGGTGGFIGLPFMEDGNATPIAGGSSPIKINSSTSEKTVRKCKKCDTLLGEKDRRKTQAEIEAAEARIIELKKKCEREAKERESTPPSPPSLLAHINILCVISIILVFYYGPDLEFDLPVIKYILGFVFLVIPSLIIFFGFLEYIDQIRDYARNRKLYHSRLLHEAKRTQDLKNRSYHYLVKFGNSFAMKEDDFFVEISGGSPEEQESCRKWVEENHPEYTILD